MNILARLGLGLRVNSSRIFGTHHTTPGFLTRNYTPRPHLPQQVPHLRLSHQIPPTRPSGILNALRLSASPSKLSVYTDGSSSPSGAGAAARASTPLGTIILKQHLPPHTQPISTELHALLLGLRLITTLPPFSVPRGRATLLADCQQAIREVVSARSRRPDNLELIARFYAELRRAGRRGVLRRLRIAWVPGHAGVPGNEAVDMDAKAAARGETSMSMILSPQEPVRVFVPPSWSVQVRGKVRGM